MVEENLLIHHDSHITPDSKTLGYRMHEYYHFQDGKKNVIFWLAVARTIFGAVSVCVSVLAFIIAIVALVFAIQRTYS